MLEHRHRVWAIVAGLTITTAASVALFYVGEREAAHTFAGAAGASFLALVDAVRVQARNGRHSAP